MEDEGANGQQLLGAAKNLAFAVSEMLKTAQPANTEVVMYKYVFVKFLLFVGGVCEHNMFWL